MSYILIVDDNKFVSSCVAVLLKKEKYHVITACNGTEAIDVIDHGIPKAIICDVDMPGMDGYTFVKKLKTEKVNNKIPVIMYTSNQNELDKNKFFALGVAYYIDKRCKTEALIHALRITCNEEPN
ncbi:MAG TPA: response regulator [Bacteroidia bacterium]|nr:response regulator [Bacteroidia bacterium]